METIHVRDVHDRYPSDSERLYASSEFVHRLANGIVGVLTTVDPNSESWVFDLILRTYASRRPYFLDKLSSWLATES